MPKPGRLIVLDGPAGVGKTVLSAGLADALGRMGVAAEVLANLVREPDDIADNTGHVREVRAGVLPGPLPARMPLFQPLHVQEEVVAADVLARVRAGKWVILDRFWWTAWVGVKLSGADGTALEAMAASSRSAWNKLAPTPAFLVRRPSTIREASLIGDGAGITAAYDEIARLEQSRHLVAIIDNTGTVGDAVALMIDAVGGIRFRSRVTRPRSSAPAEHASRGPSAGTMCLFEMTGRNPPEHPAPTATPHGVRDLPAALPDVFCPMAPAKPSPVYETYWRFAAERQSIFFRKIAGQAPLTEDPILARYKFTNAYRASDRTSQYLIRNVIYAHDASPSETFFRVMLFKLFNKVETWEMLVREVGVPRWEEYDFGRYSAVLESAMQAGQRIYSAAYIMPSGSGAFEDRRKHISHLRLLERMMRDELPLRVAECRSMRWAFELIRSYPMIGDFLAYQYVTDVNYGSATTFEEMEFVVPGPGARDGIRKCFTSLGGLTESNLIRWVAERQQAEFDRLGIAYRSLWGRPLQLIDCQNIFCEVDKYARQAHPEARGISGRTRIKQSYRPRADPLFYWYPPKWKINQYIETAIM